MLGKIRQPKLVDYLHNRASITKTPLNGTFELTPQCNMDCKMCYVKMSAKDQEAIAPLRSKEEWIALAHEAQKAGMMFLLLTGGEPFTRVDFKDIYITLHKMGFLLSVNTNGTLINESHIEWLRAYPPVRVNITLYGASNETYADLCCNPKGFSQVCRSIRLLRDAGISAKLNCSVTPANKKDLGKIIKFAREKELILEIASYLFPPTRRFAQQIGTNFRLSPSEANQVDIYKMIKDYGIDYFLSYINMKKANVTSSQPSLPEEDDWECSGDAMKCRAGRCSFWISWDGRMLLCGMLSQPQAFPFQDGFHYAWTELTKLLEKITLSGKCKKCEYNNVCKPCAAMNYTENGFFEKEPLHRCEMTKLYLDDAEKIIQALKDNTPDYLDNLL